MPCPNYRPNLTMKRYSADAVHNIAKEAHLDGYYAGYDEAKKEFSNEAGREVRKAMLQRETQRLQVAHELLTSLRFIIDP